LKGRSRPAFFYTKGTVPRPEPWGGSEETGPAEKVTFGEKKNPLFVKLCLN
jgi:hypothetical protein